MQGETDWPLSDDLMTCELSLELSRVIGREEMAYVRTTITLPDDLLKAADQAVRERKARSRNDLVVTALRHEVEALERAAIDAAFDLMGEDPTVRADAQQIDDEFSGASWEALQISESR